MSRSRFIDLVNEFCVLAQLDEPALLVGGSAIQVGGVDFIIQYDEDHSPDHLIVYCDFGHPPADRLLDAYEALLETNMVIYGASSPSFMLGPDKRVTFGYQCLLADVRAPELLSLFGNLAEQAKDWRSDYFIGAPQAA